MLVQDSTIVYTITVENTGGITLSNITLNDVLTDGNGTNLSLTSGPTLTNATAGSSASTLQAKLEPTQPLIRYQI